MITDKRYDVRLFLEGHSCPVMSISCSTAMNTSAQIEVLAAKEVRALKPSTLVVVGYRDSKASPPANGRAEATRYSIMFVGMLTGLQLTRGATQRTATLSCAGHAKLLERFYTFIADVSGDGLDRTKNFVGAASFLRGEMGATGMAVAVRNAFEGSQGPTTPGLADITGPARGALKLMELCVGALGLTPDVQQQGAQHEYFAHALAHTRLLLQLGAIPMDESVASLINENIATKTLENQAAQLKMTVSLRTVLDMILRELYYDIYPVCTPYAEVAVNTGTLQTTSAADIEGVLLAATSVNGDATTLGEALALLVDVTADMTTLDAYRGDLRAYISAVPAVARESVLQYTADQLVEYVGADMALPVAASELDAAIAQVSQRIASATAQAGTSAQVTRILNYLLLPDLSFCAPPACNVLFPNQIFSISAQLALYDQPTRLLLHAGVVQNSDAASTRGYYAPSVPEFASQQGATGKADTYVPLLPHELHTGVVPAFESFSFLDKIKTLNGFTEDEALVRIANFNLMRKRYEPNTLSVSGVFNPFACPGFPIAVLDPDDDSGDPTVFIGLLKSVAHTYSGSGQAMTSYTVTHVRDAREVDELFTGATTASLQGAVAPPATSGEYVQIQSDDVDVIERVNLAYVAALRKLSAGAARAEILGAGHAAATLALGSRTLKLTVQGEQVDALILGLLATAEGDFAQALNSPDKVEHVIVEGFSLGELDVDRAHADLQIDTSIRAIGVLFEHLTANGSEVPAFYRAYLEKMGQEFDESVRISEGAPARRNVGGVTSTGLLGTIADTDNNLRILDMLPFDFDRILDAINSGSDVAGGAITAGTGRVIGLVRGTQAQALSQNIVQEELYRPSWYSNAFSTARIGRDVYMSVLGTGSVQDKAANAPKNHVVSLGGVSTPVTSTYEAVRAAYRQYSASTNRGAFVRSYVSRPIANVADAFGTDGLFTADLIPPPVVVPGLGCGPVATTPTRTTTPTYATESILSEKDAAAKAYIVSTRKEAFR